MTKISLDFCNNHLGDRTILYQMLQVAADNKVDIVKFQLYNPDKLNKSYPDYDNYHTYLCQHVLNDNDIEYITDECKSLNLAPMFTIFSRDRLTLLDYIPGEYLLKIGSAEAHKRPLIDACLGLNKPIYVSLGMLDDQEISDLNVKYEGVLNYMYCVSKYPTPFKEIDFSIMSRPFYNGFSDHTLGIKAAKKAIKLDNIGIIEKHFTLSRDLPGKDHAMSMTPDELRELMAWKADYDMRGKYTERWVHDED